MENTIHHQACPVCGSELISLILQAKDHTVSGRSFDIWGCQNCSFRFTQDAPVQKSIGDYYKSDAYVSHTNTKKGLVNRLYHIIRRRTLKQKLSLVRKYSHLMEGNLLDIGAGTGAFLATMGKAGWQITGLEPDEEARRHANTDYNVRLAPLDNLFDLPKSHYDVITLWHVLEHVHQLHEYLDQFQDLLTQDGILVIAVPNYTSYDSNYYGNDWAAWDVPRHLWHFSPKSMDALLSRHGFKVGTHLPMKFDSFYVSMLSEPFKTGKSNLVNAFVQGMKSNLSAGSNAQQYSSVIYIIHKKEN